MTEPRQDPQRRERWPDGRRLMPVALRLAFIEDAEQDSQRRRQRALTADELRRVLRRYPGD